MSNLTADNIVIKQPSETIAVGMDFSNWLSGSESITSISSVGSTSYGCDTSDLVITGETISGQTVQMNISGGTNESRYRVEVIIVTSTGETLEGDGIMKVSDR